LKKLVLLCSDQEAYATLKPRVFSLVAAHHNGISMVPKSTNPASEFKIRLVCLQATFLAPC